MTQENNKASKYKTKAFIELGLAFVFVLAIARLVSFYDMKTQDQIVIHIITFVTAVIFFNIAHLQFLMVDLRKPEFLKNRKVRRLNYYNYLAETGFKFTGVKFLTILVGVFSAFSLLMLWFGAEAFTFNYHKIKILIVALIIGLIDSPLIEVAEFDEAIADANNNNKKHPQNNKSVAEESISVTSAKVNTSVQSPVTAVSPPVAKTQPRRRSILPKKQEHKIDITKDPADLAAARERLANASQPIKSPQEDYESLSETYAPENEEELISLLDKGMSEGFLWLNRTPYSEKLELKLLELLAIESKNFETYNRDACKILRALVLFTLKPEHCKSYLDYCIEHNGEVCIEDRILGFAITVQDETHKEKYALAFPDISLEKENDDEAENALYIEAIKEFSGAGIISYPTPAEIYDIEENHALNEERMFTGTLKLDKDLFGYLLLNSPLIRKYDGYKPNVFNEELIYKAIQLCAPDLNLEGVWEEYSDTPDASLHWIVDDTYYTCVSNLEHLAGFDWQIPMASFILETMGLKGRVFRGHGEDFDYIWFVDPDILCPLLDKYKIRYGIEEWKA